MEPREPRAAERPPSVTNMGVNLVGLIGFLGALIALRQSDWSPANRAAAAMAAAVLPVVVIELLLLRTYRRQSTGIAWDSPAAIDVPRVLTKLLGFAATLGAIALAYWAFPEYHGSFYDPFWEFLRRYGVWVLPLSVPYFVVVDAHMVDPRDGYWHAGRLVLLRGDVDGKILAAHARGWLIKAFFTPLMFIYVCQNLDSAWSAWPAGERSGFLAWYDFLYQTSFAVDVVFTAAGYILSLRITDSHLRSAEPTVLGWLVALVCYQPFWSLVSAQYIHYEDSFYWGRWLADAPWLRDAWACAILACVFVYAWATVTFGCRFSNLTHRGILTNGPYRFTKHPAYVSKNLSWWLISIPFISDIGAADALRNCLLLACLNGVYFLRARTEERHLSADPTYVAYALWMNEHGLFAWLGRLLPVFRYVPPAAAEAPVETAAEGEPEGAGRAGKARGGERRRVGR